MRIVADSPGKPKAPISMLLSPVVRRDPAPWPNAMLKLPVVLRLSALRPMAVFRPPMVLFKSALAPKAALKLPVVLLARAPLPLANGKATHPNIKSSQIANEDNAGKGQRDKGGQKSAP